MWIFSIYLHPEGVYSAEIAVLSTQQSSQFFLGEQKSLNKIGM